MLATPVWGGEGRKAGVGSISGPVLVPDETVDQAPEKMPQLGMFTEED